MLSHTALWNAIDRLAAREGISVSALARRAGLDPTSFNLSKRHIGKRQRWPSTENLMQLLRVTKTSLDDFVALASSEAKKHTPIKRTPIKIPFLEPVRARKLLPLPEFGDPRLRALVVTARHAPCPYPSGTTLLLRPVTTPRRGATIVLETGTRKIIIGVMQGKNGRALHLVRHGIKVEKIARADVVGCFTVIWTRQGSL